MADNLSLFTTQAFVFPISEAKTSQIEALGLEMRLNAAQSSPYLLSLSQLSKNTVEVKFVIALTIRDVEKPKGSDLKQHALWGVVSYRLSVDELKSGNFKNVDQAVHFISRSSSYPLDKGESVYPNAIDAFKDFEKDISKTY